MTVAETAEEKSATLHSFDSQVLVTAIDWRNPDYTPVIRWRGGL